MTRPFLRPMHTAAELSMRLTPKTGRAVKVYNRGYDDGATGEVAQYLRLSDMIYPANEESSGREISYGYNDPSGVDAIMSELATISDSGTSGDGQIAQYSYLGVGQVAGLSCTQPEIALSYAGTDNSFSGLDRFGDVLDQVWASYGAASGDAGTLDSYSYSYSAAGDRLTQVNNLNGALNETYGNDKHDRLTSADRANGEDESWTLDSLGNFTNYSNTSTGVNQSRSSDAANEITSLGGAATPVYDAAGNMTTTPDPSAPGTALNCTYDAWDRLVQVSNSSGVIAQYQYDGTGRSWSSRTSPAAWRER